MPALMPAMKNALQIVRSTQPAFSGVNGQISHMGGIGTKSGQKVDERGALRVAAIGIAVTVVVDEVAPLPIKIVRKGDLKREPQQPPKLRALWSDEPNVDQTRFGIDSSETLSMVLWGFSATMLNWTRAGELTERWPIDPSGVTLERTDQNGLRLKSSGQGELTNEPGMRPEFEFIPQYTLPGQLMPVSPVRMAAELAGLSLAYEETAARFMGRGLNPSTLLTSSTKMNTEQAREMSEGLTNLYGGSGNAGKVAVLGGPDLKLERLTMSMADAEFVAQNDRVFSVLLAMWRVPPTVAGMVEKPSTWGTGVAEFSLGLQRFTIRPIVQRRQAAHQKYITRCVDPDLQVKYPFDALLSAAPKDRVEIQRTRIMSGLTSVERVQAQEDEPPFGEDETVYSPLNMATEEDRRLQQLAIKAAARGPPRRAGATPEAAAAETGFDPSKLKSRGLPPVTLQREGA